MDFLRALRESWPYLLKGLELTVIVSILSILLGSVLGFLSCMAGLSKYRVVRWISKVYVWLIRGTPMLVQALIVYFGLPQVVRMVIPGFTITAFSAAIVTLTLNAGAYLSEIFRGGIQAVDPGQIEAARSLGLSSTRTMIRVVIPQAVRIAIPSMVNQFIITIKDSSILSVIGLGELVNMTRQYVGTTYLYFETFVLCAIAYLIIISALMWVSNRVERWLKLGDDSGPDAIRRGRKAKIAEPMGEEQ